METWPVKLSLLVLSVGLALVVSAILAGLRIVKSGEESQVFADHADTIGVIGGIVTVIGGISLVIVVA